MSDPLQFGPRRIKTAVRDHLAAQLPARLHALRTLYGYDIEDYPDPVRYDRNDALALDAFPMMTVSTRRLARMIRTEATEQGEWASAYTVSVYGYVIADPAASEPGESVEDSPRWEAALDLRDLLATATRWLLLDKPHLNHQPLGSIMLLEDGLTEDYSEPTAVSGDRWIASFSIGATVRALETVPSTVLGTDLGTVGTIQIGTEVVHDTGVTVEAGSAEYPATLSVREQDFTAPIHPALQD